MKTEKILFQSIARGATILEVMISVLLLTFGVLALMAAQLRSVASLSEAENRSIVSQAAEALAEGMQANSSLEKVGSSYGRTYTAYYSGSTSVMTVGDDSQKTTVQNGLSGTGLTKKQVANQHIAEFEYVFFANGMYGSKKVARTTQTNLVNNVEVAQLFLRVRIKDVQRTNLAARNTIVAPSGAAATCQTGSTSNVADGFSAIMKTVCDS